MDQMGRIVITEFVSLGDKTRLRLVDSTVVGDGVAILVYQP